MTNKILSAFSLAVLFSACPNNNNNPPPPPTDEICDNELDEDQDGLIDCDDSDCNTFCPSFERCDDGVDNDQDLLLDCDDPDCNGSDTCAGPEICDDTFDNDLDGDVDCEDVDCLFEAGCTTPPNQAQLDLNDGGVGLLDYSENIPNGGFFGHPTEAGDVNNDGLVDVVSCALTADGTDLAGNNKNAAGAVTIFLSDGTINGTRLPGDPNTVRILADRAFDFLGASAHVADINGDNFDDVIIGAQGYDGATIDRPMVGAVYVIFGAATLPATIDLSQTNPGVVRIVGERTGDRLGIWVGAGDLNNDGVQDLLLGADQYDGQAEDRNNAGIVYVINSAILTGPEFDLSTASLSAGGVFAQVIGEAAGDHLGGTLFGGDVDGDGKGDVAIAATMDRLSASIADDSLGEQAVGESGADGPGDTRPLAGDIHVLFGPISGTIDLADGLPNNDVIIFGAEAGDHLGEEIVLIDMDNDGADEVLLGALTVSRPGAFAVGATYIIPGGAAFRALNGIDMATPPANIIEILGDEQGEISGDTLAAPDLDGDGFREIAIARPDRTVRRNGVDVQAAGRVTIFYDVANLPPLVDLRAIDDSFSFVEVLGIDVDDTLAYSITSGDVDGDGKEELLPNLMRGDGPANAFLDAGEIYVISGARASALIGR